MNVQLTSPAGLVLHKLTWDARVFTLDYLQRILDEKAPGANSAENIVRRLVADRFASMDRTAVAFHEATEPIYTRAPHQPAPPYDALAWQLDRRWREVETRRVTICWATSRGARLCGGMAAFAKRALQLEHDLGTASVLVRLHETQPELAADWVGEDILRRDFAPWSPALKKSPDGAIVRHDQIIRVEEFCGQYSAARLRQFDSHFFIKHRIPYTLW